MDQRWSIYIDIEGFGATYSRGSQALLSLGALMEGIYRVGSKCFSDTPNRLFAHQVGDAFVIVSEFGSQSLEIPLGLSISLMRHVLFSGGATKAAVSEDEFADVVGCYPGCVLENMGEGGVVRLGGGIMTIFSVMGTALINAHKVAARAPSGSLLVIEDHLGHRLPSGIVAQPVENEKLYAIDWLHTEPEVVERFIMRAGLKDYKDTREMRLKNYLSVNDLRPEWVSNTRKYLSI